MLIKTDFIQPAELISVMYEQAAGLVDNNEEILTHLFMSYVRQNDFPKMKTVNFHQKISN